MWYGNVRISKTKDIILERLLPVGVGPGGSSIYNFIRCFGGGHRPRRCSSFLIVSGIFDTLMGVSEEMRGYNVGMKGVSSDRDQERNDWRMK